jgi:hypothetical protein
VLHSHDSPRYCLETEAFWHGPPLSASWLAGCQITWGGQNGQNSGWPNQSYAEIRCNHVSPGLSQSALHKFFSWLPEYHRTLLTDYFCQNALTRYHFSANTATFIRCMTMVVEQQRCNTRQCKLLSRFALVREIVSVLSPSTAIAQPSPICKYSAFPHEVRVDFRHSLATAIRGLKRSNDAWLSTRAQEHFRLLFIESFAKELWNDHRWSHCFMVICWCPMF